MLLTNLLQKQPARGLFKRRYPETKFYLNLSKIMFISYRNNAAKQIYNKTYLAEAYLEPSQISMDQYL